MGITEKKCWERTTFDYPQKANSCKMDWYTARPFAETYIQIIKRKLSSSSKENNELSRKAEPALRKTLT